MELGAKLQLGDYVFSLLPKRSLDFSMDRAIAKLDFPGGPPVYQDMGMNEKALDFSGSFIGDDALEQSGQLEALWWGGQELTLTYGDLQKQVRIQNYKPQILRSDRVDYSIHLIVMFPEDLIQSIADVTGGPPGSTTVVSADDPAAVEKALDRSYTVQQGDTLWDIAARADVYNDGSQWPIIAKGNGITDEYALQVGQVINLPAPNNTGASVQADQNVTKLVLGDTGQAELQSIEEGAA